MNDPIPRPFASILFGLALVALFLWQGSGENHFAKHAAQFMSKLASPPESLHAAKSPRQIHSVPDISERAEAEIKPTAARWKQATWSSS
jgi:hypothetical protein